MLGKALTLASAGNAAPAGYQISRSLRFNSADTAYLSRTPASAGNRKTWTWSGWVKRSGLGGTQQLFQVETVNGGTYTDIKFSSDKLFLDSYGPTGDLQARCVTDGVFRDVSAWYHVVAVLNTANATAADRAILYVNGVRVSQSITDGFNLDAELMINTTNEHRIGADVLGSEGYLNGYLTEVNFIDGQALTPSSFGEFNATTGVWSPIPYAGTYGTNGFYLNFSDNSGVTSTTLGKDQAGSNNWTPNNFSVTAGASNDSLVDTPTQHGDDTGAGGEVRGNYCTWNPLNSGATLSNGNLDTTSTTWVDASASIGMSIGKWYAEFTYNSSTSSQALVGITKNSLSGGGESDSFRIAYQTVGEISRQGVATPNTLTGYPTYTQGDVIGIALDVDGGTITFYKNNTSVYTLTTSVISSNEWRFFVRHNSRSFIANFGQRPFAYTAPSGFKALVTTNLPQPTVVQGDEYFNTVTRNFTGATASVSSLDFSPDFLWFKRRDGAASHSLYDRLRGTNSRLLSNDTLQALTTTSAELTSFDANGFTVGADSGQLSINGPSGGTGVVWAWKANGAGVSNTAGTISSTVSVSTTSGFSIVTYTGNNTLAQSVGHGLGSAPAMIIVKSRSNVTNWLVWQKTYNVDSVLLLNGTNALITGLTGIWGSANPTSTTFGLNRLDSDNNRSGQTYVAYCFAEVENFSKFGSYTGNGSSTDGPFVYTGFRPAWVMARDSTVAGQEWTIYDAKRDTYNIVRNMLSPTFSQAETQTTSTYDFLSNGFKLRSSDARENRSGSTFIFAAFAENPFKFALAR
jgi:hypothetical protein